MNHTIEHKTQTHDEVDSIKQSVPIPEAAIQQVKIEAEQQEKKKKKKRGLFRGKSKSKSKSKRKNNGRLRLEISAPSDMRRTAGLAMNPNTGRMELSCEDEKMAEILVNMGIVGSDDEAIKVSSFFTLSIHCSYNFRCSKTNESARESILPLKKAVKIPR